VLLPRLAVQRNRLDDTRDRAGLRDYARERREHTRQLIELGELVQRSGLVELAGGDRPALLGAFLEVVDRFREGERQGRGRADLLAPWRERGSRAIGRDEDGQAEAEHPAAMLPAGAASSP